MNANKVRIIDIGRGPQIEGHRLTVMDVFYYLHRGYDFDFIHRAMPSLTRDEFDAVEEYVKEHHAELVDEDRQAEDWISKAISEQHARGGIFAPAEENLTVEERVTRLRKKKKQKLAEKNGAHRSD